MASVKCGHLGPGWIWDDSSQNCQYSTSGASDTFTGVVPGEGDPFWAGLDFGEDLSYDYVKQFFDPYSETYGKKEELITGQAQTDIGQLFDMLGVTIGETQVLAGRGVAKARTETEQIIGASDMAYTSAQSLQDIEEKRLMSDLGASIKKTEMAKEHDVTDIGQALELDIYDLKEDWRQEQQEMLQTLLEADIGSSGEDESMQQDATGQWSCKKKIENPDECEDGYIRVQGFCVPPFDYDAGGPCLNNAGQPTECDASDCYHGACADCGTYQNPTECESDESDFVNPNPDMDCPPGEIYAADYGDCMPCLYNDGNCEPPIIPDPDPSVLPTDFGEIPDCEGDEKYEAGYGCVPPCFPFC